MSIPAELRQPPQWVVWKSETAGDRKTKIPYNPFAPTQRASSTNPDTWGSWESANTALVDSNAAGLGFVFTADGPYAGIDLDGCFNGSDMLADWAAEIIRDLDSYTEISPSGRGVHIIVRARIADGHGRKSPSGSAQRIEIYDRARYFCMTGHHLPGTNPAIEDRQAQIDALISAIQLAGQKDNKDNRSWTFSHSETGSGPENGNGRPLEGSPRPPDAQTHPEPPHSALSPLERAKRYAATLDPAIAGQRGHDRAFRAAMRLVEGFGLTKDEARPILEEFSARCTPPWSQREIDHKLNQAVGRINPKKFKELLNEELRTEARQAGARSQFHFTAAPSELEPPATDEALDRALASLNLTDDGMARAVVMLFGHRLRYVNEATIWRVYDSRWHDDYDGEVERCIIRTAKAKARAAYRITLPGGDDAKKIFAHAMKSENQGSIDQVKKSLRRQPELTTRAYQWDADDLILGLPVGAVDLKSGLYLQPDPSRLISKAAGPKFDPAADCIRTTNFLSEICGDDIELTNFLHYAIGYTLTGSISEQCFFMCFGEGKNGKSTLLNLIDNLLGEYALNASMNSFIENRNADGSRATPDIARLAGARMVSAKETTETRKLDEASIKAYTGGDPVTGRFLFANTFEFAPKMKIWLSLNQKPKISGTDEGIWRRIKLIPFLEKFELDRNLESILNSELSGLLNSAIAWCVNWYSNGLPPNQKVGQATAAYRGESDSLRQFIAECCVNDDRAYVTSEDLYTALEVWCRDSGDKLITKKQMGQQLESHGYAQIRDQRRRAWGGLRLT